ncbi:MAG: peptidase S41, partial [Proteobacteria bacterium]|nr:peptidase S41 [Pseudomonadota bacterium]
LPMNNNAALKLTTARYYTPNGRSIQASGITPDIVIDKVKISKIEEAFGTSVKEADLIGHLDNGQEEAPVTDGDNEELKKDISEEETVPLSSRDYELYEALNVLKGLAIIKK